MLVARCSLLFVRCLLLSARCSLLFACYLILFACYLLLVNCPTISHTCYNYLPSRLSSFSSLVLLKEMRMRGDSKISSCCFCVSCKSKELGGRGSPRLFHRSCSTGLWMWHFQIKSYKIISFRVISKITVNCKKMVWL